LTVYLRVGVIGWAELIGLRLVKTSHMTLFLISGLTMHHGIGLGLEHQVLLGLGLGLEEKVSQFFMTVVILDGSEQGTPWHFVRVYVIIL